MWSRIRRNWWILLATTLLGAGSALLAGFIIGDRYRAEASFIVVGAPGEALPSDEVESLAQSLEATFKSRRIARAVGDEVASDEDLSSIQERLVLEGRPQSVLLVGSYEDNDQSSALSGLQAAAAAFTDSLDESGLTVPAGATTTSSDRPVVSVEVFDPPSVLSDSVAPQPGVLAVVGALAGLLVGIGLAAIRETAQPRIDDARKAEQVFQTSVIDASAAGARVSPGRVVREALGDGDRRAVLVADLDGASGARSGFIERASNDLAAAGWSVVVLQEEQAAHEDPPTSASAPDTVPGPRRSDARRRASRSAWPESGTYGLAPPREAMRIEHHLKELESDAELVIIDLGRLRGQPVGPVLGLAQGMVLIVANHLSPRRQAEQLAVEFAHYPRLQTLVLLVDRNVRWET